MGQGAAARFLVTSFRSVPAQVAVDLYFVSEYAAPVVMGFALWRSRAVPRWLAVLFTWASNSPKEWDPTAPLSCCSCCRSRPR